MCICHISINDNVTLFRSAQALEISAIEIVGRGRYCSQSISALIGPAGARRDSSHPSNGF